MPFLQIAQYLAPHLRKQAYVPARTLGEADLVLVVHWGTTVGRNRADALIAYSLAADLQTTLLGAITDHENASAAAATSGLAPETIPILMGAERQMLDLRREREQDIDFTQIENDLSATNNAALLGFSDLLRKEQRAAVVSTTMQTIDSMLDEDRYFIIVMAYDRRALANQKIAKRLWSARISMRGAGVNFREALNFFGTVGGEFFGKQNGELKVIGAEADKR